MEVSASIYKRSNILRENKQLKTFQVGGQTRKFNNGTKIRIRMQVIHILFRVQPYEREKERDGEREASR